MLQISYESPLLDGLETCLIESAGLESKNEEAKAYIKLLDESPSHKDQSFEILKIEGWTTTQQKIQKKEEELKSL